MKSAGQSTMMGSQCPKVATATPRTVHRPVPMKTAGMHVHRFRANGLVLFLLGLAAVVAESSDARADSGRSDGLALHAIFAEQHVQAAALDMHRRTMRLDDQERYERLVRWVLPGPEHDTLRLQSDFSPLDPAPPVDLDPPDSADGQRLHSGGRLVAPALDLIDVADRLGKLDVIREMVTQWPPPGEGTAPIDRQAMLLLLELAGDASAVSSERLHQVLVVASADAAAETPPSAAEMLLFQTAIKHPHLRTTVADAVHLYQPWVTSTHTNRSAAQQHVAKWMGMARASQFEAIRGDTAPTSSPLQQWLPASRSTAASRGLGYPIARWDRFGGTVANRASHDDDYLYFAVPIRGNFEIECEVSDFAWRDSHLMVAGTWVAPVYTLSDYDIGHFRNTLPRVSFTPPLTKVKRWIRYRTTVRDSLATTYFNGRLVHQQPLTDEHDPWIAIRSTPQHDGEVRNIRVTGDPEIPTQVRMSIDPELSGWLPYDEEGRYRRTPLAWQHTGDLESGGEIRSVGSPAQVRRSYGPFGTNDPARSSGPGHVERLLRYHRPMMEDGTMIYEFFYTAGETLVHPAIDRLALLLDPAGVQLHWITDGRFDRTGLDPANVQKEPEGRLLEGSLPLEANGWNQIKVQLVGDQITLVLNDQPIFARPLEPTNQRTFGLFHFADRTTVRVRNVVWQGKWPRQLPQLDQQELFIDETGFLEERLPRLTARFTHDFAAEGFPVSHFTVVAGDPAIHIRPRADGLHVTRPGTGGYRNASISPLLSIGGDFDITATFDQLQTDPQGPGAASTIWLAAGNTEENDARLLRRQILTGGDQQLVQCVRVFRREGELQRRYFSHQAVEAQAGTLRLARRGDQIYYLFAENDSNAFRILGQEKFHTDDIAEPAIELASQIYGKAGSTSVVWKNVSVRAERLGGRALGDHQGLMATLNRQRDALQENLSVDFVQQAPDPRLFARWTDLRSWNQQDGGLPIVHPGVDQWQSAGASLLKQLEGDFDVAVEFDLEQLDDPANGLQSAIYLQLELADAAETQVSMIFSKRSGQGITALAQIRVPDGADGYSYRNLGSLGVISGTGLRIARRDERVYFITTSEQLGGESVVASTDVGKEPIGVGSTRLLVHAGGEGRESQILWKGITVHADKLHSDTPATAPAPPPVQRPVPTRPRQKEKSYFDSFLDIFR